MYIHTHIHRYISYIHIYIHAYIHPHRHPGFCRLNSLRLNTLSLSWERGAGITKSLYTALHTYTTLLSTHFNPCQLCVLWSVRLSSVQYNTIQVHIHIHVHVHDHDHTHYTQCFLHKTLSPTILKIRFFSFLFSFLFYFILYFFSFLFFFFFPLNPRWIY
ncbi:hypothetical protein F4810DRAFT_22687 [Camillea tinctor]|nr:hypothetical protein F4810DRAFT_22687 [Camillea tinctor]